MIVWAGVANNSSLGIDYQQDASGYRAQSGSILCICSLGRGIIIGKGLHLPFTQVLICGKMAILLTYIGIIYFAIKRLKYGKTLLAFVALTPSTCFWQVHILMIGGSLRFFLAGFSYYISELQYRERKLSVKICSVCFSAFCWGVLPKWVYGILMATFSSFLKINLRARNRDGLLYDNVPGNVVGVVLYWYCPVFIRGLGQGDIEGEQMSMPRFS